MQKHLILKLGAIFGVVLVLMFVLSMIRGVITERKNWRDEATRNISQSYAGKQTLIGPVLVIPYEELTTIQTQSPLAQRTETTVEKRRGFEFVIPESIALDGTLKTEERYRGIYRVPTYSTDVKVSGGFTLTNDLTKETNRTMLWKEAFLWVSVSDNRGILSRPVLNWQGAQINFTPGATDEFNLKHIQGAGISAPVQLPSQPAGKYSFAFDMTVAGTQQLSWLPSAKDMTVTLAANWPHPSFSGNFLPTEREVTKQGFTATWKISHFASNAVDLLQSCVRGDCESMKNNVFGVDFMTPVDAYHQTERAIKYGLMFISLTFLAFFLFETMKRLPIHPIQYGLVGVSLAIFFQLLISLSEHMAFITAYVTAAFACIALIGVYVSAVLKSGKRGAGFASGLGILYGTLYALLQSEDNALLMGSLLIFGVLASVMLLTRNIDWYKISTSKPTA